jgi:RHS repeat-associated protein
LIGHFVLNLLQNKPRMQNTGIFKTHSNLTMTRSTDTLKYYAFGSAISEMQFKSDTGGSYRYGFNGEELMNELSGDGMAYDLGERFYDGRLGKMFSLDPLSAQYPWQSPYAYCYNNPIWIVDVKGMGGGTEREPATHTTKKGETLWGVSKDYYNQNKKEIGMSWGNYWELVLKWNNGGDYGKTGGTMYLSDQSKKSDNNQRNEDIKSFNKYPDVDRNLRRPDLWKASRVDADGNYFDNVTTWSGLYHASNVGTEVCNIKGDLLNSLKNNIQNFYGPTGSSFYQPIINEYEKKKKTENVNYLVGKDFVRFGPISKVDASTYKSTYTMRNAYSFYWIEDFD